MLSAQFSMEDFVDATNQPDAGQAATEKSWLLLAGTDNCI